MAYLNHGRVDAGPEALDFRKGEHLVIGSLADLDVQLVLDAAEDFV